MLYHYTSLETLLAILQNSYIAGEPESRYITLRATHAYFLNDSKEAQLLIDALVLLGIPERIIRNCEMLLGYPYVCSLTEKGDDLNMWRGYANNAVGVSIGFEKGVFETIKEYQKSSLDEYFFFECEYTDSTEIAEMLKDELFVKQLQSSIENQEEHIDITELSRKLLDIMRYKHKAFSEEKEYRVVINSVFDEKYKVSSDVLIPYKEFSVPFRTIKEIILGPKVDTERTTFSIGRLFKQLGNDNIKIVKSEIPYQ